MQQQINKKLQISFVYQEVISCMHLHLLISPHLQKPNVLSAYGTKRSDNCTSLTWCFAVPEIAACICSVFNIQWKHCVRFKYIYFSPAWESNSLNLWDADHIAQGCVLLCRHIFVVVIKHLWPSECLKGLKAFWAESLTNKSAPECRVRLI